MIRNKIVWTGGIIVLILLLASCSSVFEAGLSGTVVDEETNAGISGVMVYAYTSESLRDSDYDKGVSIDDTGMNYTFAPSFAGNYIPSTSTNANGQFTISKLVWKNTSPQFGKTADYQDIYLLYFHPNYGLMKESSKVTIVSDSNNASRVSARMASLRESKNVVINLVNAAYLDANDKKSGAYQVNVPVVVSVKGYKASEYNTSYQPTSWYSTPFMNEEYTVLDGNLSFTVNYEKALAGNPKAIKLEVSILEDVNSAWHQVAKTGSDEYYKSTAKLEIDDSTIRNITGTTSFDLWMKGYEFPHPQLSGRITTESKPPTLDPPLSPDYSLDENVNLWLARGVLDSSSLTEQWNLYVIDGENAHTVTGRIGDGSNGGLITYGTFSGFGAGLDWIPDLLSSSDYKEKIGVATLFIIIDKVKGVSGEGGIVGVPDLGDWFVKLDFSSRYLEARNLGILKALTATAANVATVNR